MTKWLNLSKSFAPDIFYLAYHIVKKKIKGIKDEKIISKNSNIVNISLDEFKNKIKRLFSAMGYNVVDLNESIADTAILFLDLKDQSILVYAIKRDSAIQVADVERALNIQRKINCSGSILISITDLDKGVLEFANINGIAIVTKERLSELMYEFNS